MDNNFHLIINQLIKDLEKGKNSVQQMRDILDQRCAGSHHDHQDYYKGLDAHSTVALTALDSSLSTLRDFGLEINNFGNSSKLAKHTLNKKDKRGCYKRRRGVEPVITETTNLTDDGYAWRKYGQKLILNAQYPRNYYRCTHKLEQGCQATKQVQQISENPKKFRLIYLGDHSCKLKTPQFILNQETLDSSFYLNFETNRTTPNANMVKSEYGPIKVETQSEAPSNLNHQYISSTYSPDPTTTTTPRSEISSVDHEGYSDMASPHGVDIDVDDYSYMMADSGDIDIWRFLLDGNP